MLAEGTVLNEKDARGMIGNNFLFLPRTLKNFVAYKELYQNFIQ